NIYYLFSFKYTRTHPHPHSFPTRRSSDLVSADRLPVRRLLFGAQAEGGAGQPRGGRPEAAADVREARHPARRAEASQRRRRRRRSEEHTSELQSRGHLVCRLLLEKKKKKK